MDHIKNALRLSPGSKKRDEEAPIFNLISKISNADSRDTLSKFFKDDFSKPTGCSSNLWALLIAFGDVLVKLLNEQNSVQHKQKQDDPMDTSNAWSKVSGNNRKRLRSSLTENHSPIENVDAFKEAERQRSVVICHFPESEKTNFLQAERDDETSIRLMIHKLTDQAKVEKMYRMGKKIPNGRPRLIKVVLCTSSMQRAVLSCAKNLRNYDEFKKIYIRKSLTPAELQASNEKRATLRWLREKDARWVIYRDNFWIRDDISGGIRSIPVLDIPPHCANKRRFDNNPIPSQGN